MNKKAFLVTGGNKGIGKEIVKQLAQRGHKVYFGARSNEKGSQAMDDLQIYGDVQFVRVDLNDSDSMKAAADYIQSDNGFLDGLINNAGMIDGYETASSVTLASLRKTFDTNVFGTIQLTQLMLPLLHAGAAKVIVNVSTGLGSLGMHGDPSWPFHSTVPFAYNSSKTALNMFTVLLAKELRAEGFKINSVSPGWIATDLGGENAPGDVAEGAAISVECALKGDSGSTGLFLTSGGLIPW